MVQKRTTPIDGAKLKKHKSNDLIKLPLKLSEPGNLVIASPLQTIKPTSEVLASQEAKAYLAGANSLSYSPNCSPERMANSEITQDLAQVTHSHSLSPSIFLNDEEKVDLEELLASDQPNGAMVDIWKDIDDVYLSNIPREFGTELIRDSSANPVACNADDSSWVEKRPEFVEYPTVIPIDMNSAPPDDNEPNSSIVETVRSNLPVGWVLNL
ncbi:hypothetical protein COLO4_35631 [Corchorus olitorius]|uniref:Uncharacterized protein n=1 Tax=Corchorus olitorius TaxID=93759 RepID=A0A1R3GED6_9ROSI|nr:hypothetical protein COLO4_35631 [Corchorus olitorius]